MHRCSCGLMPVVEESQCWNGLKPIITERAETWFCLNIRIMVHIHRQFTDRHSGCIFTSDQSQHDVAMNVRLYVVGSSRNGQKQTSKDFFSPISNQFCWTWLQHSQCQTYRWCFVAVQFQKTQTNLIKKRQPGIPKSSHETSVKWMNRES